jgi:hypothetical protein
MRCGFWIGAEGRFCWSTVDVRRFKDGHFCPAHTPAETRKLVQP